MTNRGRGLGGSFGLLNSGALRYDFLQSLNWIVSLYCHVNVYISDVFLFLTVNCYAVFFTMASVCSITRDQQHFCLFKRLDVRHSVIGLFLRAIN